MTRPKLPVTLLSGFLGAGKTTLLERILLTPHGYRIGVIVNDMGALNIDAALLATHHTVAQTDERVVALQNGCICCTLRGDLLEEVARLATEGAVDYLVIESSGVSEPMQVAETFSEEFAEMHVAAGMALQEEQHASTDAKTKEQNARLADILKQGGLSRIARLDCCVTMVDAVNVLEDFHTADFLVDRQHDGNTVPPEDDRNVSDLQTDQIEFANVVIVNKCDVASRQDVERTCALVRNLNPSATVLTSTRANVDVGALLDTKRFDYAQAAMGAGWLRSLREEVLPETEEYGIGSFVFRARRPFHPARLWHTVKDVFVVIQEEFIDDGEEGDKEGDEASEEAMDVDDNVDERQPQLNPKARLASKKANATFAPLLRSKGFVWLATRPNMFGEWSQAGVMLTLAGGDAWHCTMAEDEWPEDEQVRRAIRADFEGVWGDRRQEIVLIGLEMKRGGKQRLHDALQACLLDNAEWSAWEAVMNDGAASADEKKGRLEDLFEDGFEDWKLADEDDDDEDHDGHHHPPGHHKH